MGAVKREISFTNLDGEPVTEEWYFSMDEEDASQTDLAARPDLKDYLAAVDKNQDAREVMNIWRTLVIAAAGRREGNLLIKDAQVRREFEFGGAYKQLFAELVDAPDAGLEFFMKIFPEKVQKQLTEEMNKKYSKDEMLAMDDEEFDRLIGTDLKLMTKEQQMVAFQRRNHKASA